MSRGAATPHPDAAEARRTGAARLSPPLLGKVGLCRAATAPNRASRVGIRNVRVSRGAATPLPDAAEARRTGAAHPSPPWLGKDRGRDRVVALPLPPNRTGGFPASGFPVGGRSMSWPLVLGLRLRRSIQVRRSRHWASADDPVPELVLCLCVDGVRSSGVVRGSNDPASERRWRHCV